MNRNLWHLPPLFLILGILTLSCGTGSGLISDRNSQISSPSNLRGAAKNRAILAEWNPVSKATFYQIYWGTASGAYTDSITTSSSEEVIGGLRPEVKYYVAVTALDDEGRESDYSNEINAIPYASTSDPDNPPTGE
jgi:fibronectin type 3 domain-containing protein